MLRLLVILLIPAVFGGGQVHLTVQEFTLSDPMACESSERCAIDLQLCVGTPDVACVFVNRSTHLDSVDQLLASEALSGNFSRGWNEAVVVTVRIRNGSTKRLVLLSRSFVDLSATQPKTITASSAGNHITFQVQAKCNEGYSGDDCISYCPPPGLRDNFVCTSNGRECLSGWTGVDCKEPVCENGCRNGKCVAPNTCSCILGWTGDTCADCVTYKGCKNGYCTRPGSCVCKPNWTGRFCDKVVDKCADKPCQNGGICTSVEHNTFLCVCPEGFTGATCSDKMHPCAKQPCGPNGVCINTGSSSDDYVCQCDEGFVGRNCNRVQAASRGRPPVKMNLTVNDIKVTVRASNSSASIEQQLDLLTVLVVLCLLLVVVVVIGLCITGKYLQSLKAWTRRDVTPENINGSGGLEDHPSSGHVHSEKRPSANSDSALIWHIMDNNPMGLQNLPEFQRSMHVPSPPPSYESSTEQADERTYSDDYLHV